MWALPVFLLTLVLCYFSWAGRLQSYEDSIMIQERERNKYFVVDEFECLMENLSEIKTALSKRIEDERASGSDFTLKNGVLISTMCEVKALREFLRYAYSLGMTKVIFEIEFKPPNIHTKKEVVLVAKAPQVDSSDKSKDIVLVSKASRNDSFKESSVAIVKIIDSGPIISMYIERIENIKATKVFLLLQEDSYYVDLSCILANLMERNVETLLVIESRPEQHQQEESSIKSPVRKSISIEELEALVKQLGSENYHEREAAMKILMDFIDVKPFVFQYLKKSIKTTEDEEIKRRLNKILKPYKEWDITITVLKKFPDILNKLHSDDESIRRKIIEELGESGLESAVQPLVRLLGHESGDTWESLKKAIIKMGKSAEEPVIEALDKRYWGTRYHAAELLGEIRSKKAVEPLIKTLNDHHHDVRDRAVVALDKTGDKRAIGPLINMLKDSDFYVRIHANDALLRFGDAAVGPLIEALKNEEFWIRDGAFSLLEKITKQDFQNYEECKNWYEKNKSK